MKQCWLLFLGALLLSCREANAPTETAPAKGSSMEITSAGHRSMVGDPVKNIPPVRTVGVIGLTTTNPGDQLYPTKIGNYWVYAETLRTSTEVFTRTKSVWITGTWTDDLGTWTYSAQSPDTGSFYYNPGPDELWFSWISGCDSAYSHQYAGYAGIPSKCLEFAIPADTTTVHITVCRGCIMYGRSGKWTNSPYPTPFGEYPSVIQFWGYPVGDTLFVYPGVGIVGWSIGAYPSGRLVGRLMAASTNDQICSGRFKQ